MAFGFIPFLPAQVGERALQNQFTAIAVWFMVYFEFIIVQTLEYIENIYVLSNNKSITQR